MIAYLPTPTYTPPPSHLHTHPHPRLHNPHPRQQHRTQRQRDPTKSLQARIPPLPRQNRARDRIPHDQPKTRYRERHPHPRPEILHTARRAHHHRRHQADIRARREAVQDGEDDEPADGAGADADPGEGEDGAEGCHGDYDVEGAERVGDEVGQDAAREGGEHEDREQVEGEEGGGGGGGEGEGLDVELWFPVSVGLDSWGCVWLMGVCMANEARDV